jgi:hypothetical protein
MTEVSSWVVQAEKARLTDEERQMIDERLLLIGIDRKVYAPYIRRQVVDLDANRGFPDPHPAKSHSAAR